MTQCKWSEKQAFLLPNIIITERNEEWTSWALQKCKRNNLKGWPKLATTPACLYLLGLCSGSCGSTRRFTISGLQVHLCFAPLGLGDGTHSPERFHHIPEADPLLCGSVEKIRRHQRTCPLWLRKQCLDLQIKWILHGANGFSFFLSLEHLTTFILNWCEITWALIMWIMHEI